MTGFWVARQDICFIIDDSTHNTPIEKSWCISWRTLLLVGIAILVIILGVILILTPIPDEFVVLPAVAALAA